MSRRIGYFAYGSNLHPLRLALRAPAYRCDAAGHIAGFRMAFHKRSRIDGSGKCNIVATGNPRDVVHGFIYRLTPDETARLDDEEVVHGGYARIDVDVALTDGASTRVFTYQAPQEIVDDRLMPYDWYHQVVVQGARHHGLPDEYIAQLEAMASQIDGDIERRRPFDELLSRL